MQSHTIPPLLPFLLLLVVLAIAALAVTVLLARRGGAKFKLKNPLLSPPEQELYRRLVEALPEHRVLAQVAFSQMLYVDGGDQKENFRKNLTARQKVADFVVCDKSFKVTAVIELDDSTHNAAKDAARDALVQEAGCRTIRWRATKIPSVSEIRAELSKA